MHSEPASLQPLGPSRSLQGHSSWPLRSAPASSLGPSDGGFLRGPPPGVLLRTTRFVNQSLSQMLGASGVLAAADHPGGFMEVCQRWRLGLADRWLPFLLLCTAAGSLPADTGCSRPCSSTSSVGSDDSSCREMMEQVFSALMGATLPCLKWQLQRDFGTQWRHVSGCPPGSASCMGSGSCYASVTSAHPSPAAHLACFPHPQGPTQVSCLAHCCTHQPLHSCHGWLLPLLQALAH